MIQTLPDLFEQTAKSYGPKKAFLTRVNKQEGYVGPTWEELYENAKDLATGLADLGLEPKEHVAVLADNRFEWILSDYAILMNGAANVPRGTDVTDEEIEYIVQHSESTMLFVEHEKMLNRVVAIKEKLPLIRSIIVMDRKYAGSEVAQSIYSVLEKGKKLRAEGNQMVAERQANIKPSDLFTIIYTSGTTGKPKGVMLTHANMVSQVKSVTQIVSLSSDDRNLSILPVWHAFERVVEYLFISVGAATYYTSIRTLANDIKDVKPTFMGSAPRLWESIYQKIVKKVEAASPVAKFFFNTSILSKNRVRCAQAFFNGSLLQMQKLSMIDRIGLGIKHLLNLLAFGIVSILFSFVRSKLRMAMGGQMKGTISGGGALPRHIDMFFNDIGLKVLEGYGMTECCPVISVRTFDKLVIGSVGGPIPGTQIEIRDCNNLNKKLSQGESGVIFVKGPQVMQGYYKNEEATQKVLDQGWMNTGDIGLVNFNDTISITGRAKDTIVLLSGENVEPVPIENKLTESSFISQVMVVGQDQKSLSALVVLDEEKMASWTNEQGMGGKIYSELAHDDKVQDLVRLEIRKQISAENGFKAFERINGFKILPKDFEVGDELTNLFKLKRHVITKKYQGLISDLYP